MKYLYVSLMLIALIIYSLPAYADASRDYIDNEVAEWTRLADEDGQVILESIVDLIKEDLVVYCLSLAPGRYHIYVSGGMKIEDIDLSIDTANGKNIDSDTSPDKIPIVVAAIHETTDLILTLTPCSSTGEFAEDYYCIVIASEGKGEILSMSEPETVKQKTEGSEQPQG